jgi:hypothetical protein
LRRRFSRRLGIFRPVIDPQAKHQFTERPASQIEKSMTPFFFNGPRKS